MSSDLNKDDTKRQAIMEGKSSALHKEQTTRSAESRRHSLPLPRAQHLVVQRARPQNMYIQVTLCGLNRLNFYIQEYTHTTSKGKEAINLKENREVGTWEVWIEER